MFKFCRFRDYIKGELANCIERPQPNILCLWFDYEDTVLNIVPPTIWPETCPEGAAWSQRVQKVNQKVNPPPERPVDPT